MINTAYSFAQNVEIVPSTLRSTSPKESLTTTNICGAKFEEDEPHHPPKERRE